MVVERQEQVPKSEIPLSDALRRTCVRRRKSLLNRSPLFVAQEVAKIDRIIVFDVDEQALRIRHRFIDLLEVGQKTLAPTIKKI